MPWYLELRQEITGLPRCGARFVRGNKASANTLTCSWRVLRVYGISSFHQHNIRFRGILYVYSNEKIKHFFFLVLRASHACSRHVCVFAPRGPWWSVRPPVYFLGTLRNLEGVLGRAHIVKSAEFAHCGAIAFQRSFFSLRG